MENVLIFSNLYADTQINNWGFSERRGGISNVQMLTRDTLQEGNGSLGREVRQKLLVPIVNLGEQFDSLSYEQLIKRLKFQVKS